MWTPKAYCVDCGVGLRFAHSIRCRACFMTVHTAKDSRPKCVDCGKPINWNNKTRKGDRCQDCRVKHNDVLRLETGPKCPECGGPVATTKTKVCMTCINQRAASKAEQRLCSECGVKVSPGKSLCRPCYMRIQKEAAANRVCTICGKKAKARGLCANHYKAQYPDLVNKRVHWGMKARIKASPCALCGYCKFPVVQPHRPIPELGYVMGNMVPLCPTCHTEVTLGYTPSPSHPWYPDWYDVNTQSVIPS